MEHTLKLTITAVGENDSVFLTPCEPMTLHESSIERTEEEAAEAEAELDGPVRGDGLPAGRKDVMLMIED